VDAARRETAPRRLRAGIVGRAHGLDGSFHVSDVAAEVFAIVELGGEVEIDGQARRVARLAGHAGRPILRLEGAASRDDAEALRGQPIWISRTSAPELEEDEWWAEDLEGCAVCDGERAVGTVARMLALPSCEVLEVRWADDPDRPALLVPLVRDAVRDVDLEAKRIDVDLAFLGEG
jgi:16S rRNA processing protein RimM